MRVHVRIPLLATVVVLVALVAPGVAGATPFGIERWIATNCKVGHETCGQEAAEPHFPKKEITVEEAKESGYTIAGGRVPFGITDFKVNTVGTYPTAVPAGGAVTHIRTDVATGLATSPVAVPQCKLSEFGTTELAPGSGLYGASTCKTPETVIGENKVVVYAGELVGDLALQGSVYNLEPSEGLASEFGVSVKLPEFLSVGLGFPPGLEVFAHTLIEGSVEWGKGVALEAAREPAGTLAGDYHDFFEIKVSPALPLISSRLIFKGRSGNGAFITNATACPGDNTTFLTLEDANKETSVEHFTTPIGLEKCKEVPFNPGFSLAPATFGPDEPDGFTTAVEVEHEPAEEVDNSEVKTVTVTMPEGMTLDPSAAPGLTACTPAQARIHSSTPGVACPASSKLGTVNIEVPTLPPGSLTGNIYLGGPESGPITSPPFTIYLDAESARYGVSVRLKGETIPNELTGQVTTVFTELPEQPFTKATLHFNEGALAPIANPLTCGATSATALLTPYAAEPPATEGTPKASASAFAFTGCVSPIALKPSQSTAVGSPNAGAKTSFTFSLERPEADQYLSKVTTKLPPGLVGAVPAVAQCSEEMANLGTCPEASRIGTATVLSGSGPTPASFSGPVYFTGPYQGAPFGLSIAVPATAGPFSLGTVVTRATINVDQYTGQVIVASTLPRIFKGVPLRLRRITVAVEKAGFMSNPTNCAPLNTESSVAGFVPASTEAANVVATSPFQVVNCGALAFKPSFGAATSAKVSKANGSGIETTLKMPAGDANVKSVLVQLPRALASRLSTLNKACLAANFNTNPFTCPSGSFVGSVRAKTPVLPGTLSGPAIFVSHGGEAFPDLDLVLQGDGVRVILVGHTKITGGITTTNFSMTPDVPVNSVTVTLPAGPHSAVTNFGEPALCPRPLLMPTTITGWNGVTYKKNTVINVSGCGVRIVGHKVIGRVAYLTVQTFAPGRLSGSGAGLQTVYKHLKRAAKTTSLKVPLRSGAGGRIKVRVGFVPAKNAHGAARSSASVTLRFP